jgi:chemotaxis protein MotB
MSVKKFLKTAQDIKDQAGKRPPDAPKPEANHDESNWLVSYADMMTLLCGFFILLFSMAKMDEPKYEKVKEAVSKQFGGEYHAPTQELAKFVTQVIQEAGLEKEATLKTGPTGLSVAFQSTLFFDTLSAEIRPQGKAVLEKLIANLATEQSKTHKNYQIVVEGHTDSRPILAGVYPSNWELSSARASRVVRMFLDHAFSPDKLTAIGYGDTRPEVPHRTALGAYDEKALLKNRRVVLRILEPQVDSIPFPEKVERVPAATSESQTR